MATAPLASDNPETQRHYAAQFALSAALVVAIRRLWPMVDVRDLKATLPPYKAALSALVGRFGSASASLAADHYQTVRLDAGVRTPFRLPAVGRPPSAKIDASLNWATGDLWDSRLLKPPEGFDPSSVTDAVQTKVEGSAQKTALDQGRELMASAAIEDRAARGWVRVARPNACPFCLLLATRGVVEGSTIYRSQQSADFQAHDNCHCTAEPVFGVYEAPHHVREAAALYADSTKDVGDKLNAFRRAVEAQRRGA